MGENTKIQWSDNTWNPWHGCHKVSDGCKFCYMFRDKARYGQDGNDVRRSKYGTFHAPLKWKDPALIFTCSWSDWFIEEADPWRDDAWKVIRDTPQHTYQILTKRPERILDHLPADWGAGYDNVWLGVSVENQKAADERIPQLIRVPARVRFLSAEPLLGPIDLTKVGHLFEKSNILIPHQIAVDHGSYSNCPGIDWVIVGGESGNEIGQYRYRPCELEWISDLVFTCQKFDCPVFVKQLGRFLALALDYKDRNGGDINEFPEPLRVRQMPRGFKSFGDEMRSISHREFEEKYLGGDTREGGNER